MWGFPGQEERDGRKGWGRDVNKKRKKWRCGNSDDSGVGGGEDKRGTLRGGTRIGEVLTWTSSEKPVCTEPSKMELRVVPTYNVSPRPSATVRTGPKSSGT